MGAGTEELPGLLLRLSRFPGFGLEPALSLYLRSYALLSYARVNSQDKTLRVVLLQENNHQQRWCDEVELL